jgi:hypothetical protein
MITIDFGDYKALQIEESHMIDSYYGNYDLTPFAELLRKNKDMSQGMRDFIADILTGKIKRPNGKKASTINRDIEIMFMVDELLNGGMSLTSSKNIDGAASSIAEKLHLTEEATLKAYQRAVKYRRENGVVRFSPDGEIIGVWGSDPDPSDFMD